MSKEKVELETPDSSVTNLAPGAASATPVVTTPVVATTQAVATTSAAPRADFFSAMPRHRIKIAYAVSQNMPDEAVEGSLVLRDPEDRWVKIASPNTPVVVLLLSARVYYKEWLTSDAFNAGSSPKAYATKEEAIADGQTVEWSPDGTAPTVSPAVDITMLVERPKDLAGADDAFVLALDGRVWAPCIMTVDKSNAKKAIDALSRLILRDITTNKVTREQARLSAFFCTLTINGVSSPRNPGRKIRVPSFSVLLDDNHRALSPSEEFNKSLIDLVNLFNDPTNCTADPDEM